MRNRLVLAFVTVVVAFIVLYGVPRAFVLGSNVQDDAEEAVARGAEVAALIVAEAVDDSDPVTADLLEPLLREGERIAYSGQDGRTVAVPDGSALAADDLVASRDVGGGTLTYSLSSSQVRDHVVAAILPVIVLGLALIPVAVLVGAGLARRLARPFSELAQTARGMGAGRLRVDPPYYGVPEADEIATALRDSGRRLDLMLERERDVAVNASHELRTPITALRLALEDVTQWPDTTPEVAAELDRLVGEVDRLSEAVTTLLDARRRWSTGDASA